MRVTFCLLMGILLSVVAVALERFITQGLLTGAMKG